MNSTMHCRISARRWGGVEDDYREIHDFIDSTKVLCADNRHRILHTMWGVNEVIVPIFGHTLINSDGKEVNVKDMCERDHLLVDFANKFIPTLGDFVENIDVDTRVLAKQIEVFHETLPVNDRLTQLLLSPLSSTGSVKSLLVTHNSWFINDIVPRILKCRPVIQDFSLTPADLFHPMTFRSWMNNGLTYPPSAEKMLALTARN